MPCIYVALQSATGFPFFRNPEQLGEELTTPVSQGQSQVPVGQGGFGVTQAKVSVSPLPQTSSGPSLAQS